VAAVLLVSGCGAARSAGSSLTAGALERLRAEDTTLIALDRRLADSTGAFLSREFAGAVLDPAQATWKNMRLAARREADGISADLEIRVRTGLDDALRQLLADNFDVLDARMSILATGVSQAFAEALGRDLSASLAPAGDTLVRRLIQSAAVGMERDLRPALHALMLEARDSLRVRIRDVDRAVAGSKTVSEVRYALFGAAGAALATGLLLAFGHWRRQGRALHALIDAVEKAGDDGTKRAVRTCAQEAGVHGWLSERVAARTAGREKM